MKPLKITLILTILITQIVTSFAQEKADPQINLKQMKMIGTVDKRYQSFNVEMCEVIGGEFWIPYNLIDSVRKHSDRKGIDALKWKINPINLYERKLRNLAAALGPTYIRVSGTWANAIYFQDNDEPKLPNPPDGFKNILTHQQWKGVVDFCKAVDGKLVSSFPISDGVRDKEGNWTSTQIKSILDYTRSIGGEIVAAEMFNEPSHASHGNAPKGYNGENFAKDFARFKSFANKEAPTMKIIGPGSIGEGGILTAGLDLSVDKLLSPTPKPTFDVFTYHYYGTVSKRCGGGQKPEMALTNDWLSKTEKGLEFYQNARNKYNPGAPIWLTETAETACGGNPMAATYIDTFRYLEQLGRLAKKGVQVVMHNTLARSEYALLDNDTHNPRPDYWAALLWNKFMGTQVYEAGTLALGVDIFTHNLKNNTAGRAVLVVNTTDNTTSIEVPSEGKQYLLTSDDLLSQKVLLNGKELLLTKDDAIPVINGETLKKGKVQLPAHSIVFLTFIKI